MYLSIKYKKTKMKTNNENINENAEVENLKNQLKVLTDKLKVFENSEKLITSESCKTPQSYHFSMQCFKEVIFKMIAKNLIDTKYIVSDNDKFLTTTKDFKTYFIENIALTAIIAQHNL